MSRALCQCLCNALKESQIRIISIEHLISCIDKGCSDFCISNGLLRSHKTIMKMDDEFWILDKFWILNELDGSEELLTLEELKESNIGRAIQHGNFYLHTF